MSQAKKIYEYFGRAKNEAADSALLLGFRRAEEPYRTVILENILERGNASAAFELVRQFHKLCSRDQNTVLGQVGQLYGGLYKSADAGEIQTRLNALSLIEKAGYEDLTELVALMCRDRDSRISQKAGELLLEMARQNCEWSHPEVQIFDESESDKAIEAMESESDEVIEAVESECVEVIEGVEKKMQSRQRLEKSLRATLKDFKIHQRVDAVLAAMIAVPLDNEEFWGSMLEPYEVVGKVVRHVLIGYDRAELAGFCVSALGHPGLRSTAARAISMCGRREFILAVAHELTRQSDEKILTGLKLVTHPVWVEAGKISTADLTERQEKELIGLVSKIGASETDCAGFVLRIAQQGGEAAGLRAMAIFAGMEAEWAGEYVEKLTHAQHENVAMAAYRYLAKQNEQQKQKNLYQIMAEGLKSRHEKVQEQAREYFAAIAFERYWENYERLSSVQKTKAGQAVFKLDKKADEKWRVCAGDLSPQKRMRAVKIARRVGRLEIFSEALLKLSSDADARVRSCAVASLGEMRTRERDSQECLMKALHDRDHRVQANAIEALGQRDCRGSEGQINRFANSRDNRVRANAIRTLLNWRVDSARRSIKEMLTDPRPRHRKSAHWVAEKINLELSGSQGKVSAGVGLTARAGLTVVGNLAGVVNSNGGVILKDAVDETGAGEMPRGQYDSFVITQ
ncbi:MAG: HEAT repeat domain-containing protein [Sedimentisphaerales bacterium]|nr:HEAT repeat domain-containing protein [Sedimentisphaerales bacterium]